MKNIRAGKYSQIYFGNDFKQHYDRKYYFGMEVNDMKEMDCIEVVVEKERYAKEGVHKGMPGWICDHRLINGTWLVNFPQYGGKDDIATMAIKEKDLRLLQDGMDAKVNERIKTEHGE